MTTLASNRFDDMATRDICEDTLDRLVGSGKQGGESRDGTTGGGEVQAKLRFELRDVPVPGKGKASTSSSVEHRNSTLSLAETLSPPPAYEAADSAPKSSSSIHAPTPRVLDDDAASTHSSLSDPTSDSEDPLNDLLRLTTTLLATSTSILASSTALQGSLSKLLTSDAARSPPSSSAAFPTSYAEAEAPDIDDEVEPPFQDTSAMTVEQDLRSELALAGDAEDRLSRLSRDAERFDLRRRAKDPSTLFAGTAGREGRAERGRTLYVTAEAAGQEGARRHRSDAAVFGGGGMRRSPSAATVLLGKLAASPKQSGAGKVKRSTSYATGTWSSFLAATPSSQTSRGPVASSSKVTLDDTFLPRSASRSATVPSLALTGASSESTPSPFSTSTPLAPLSPTRAVYTLPSRLSPARPDKPNPRLPSSVSTANPFPPTTPSPVHLPRPSLRRSPSSRDLIVPAPASPSLSLSTSHSLSPSTSFSSLAPSTPSLAATSACSSTPHSPSASLWSSSLNMNRKSPSSQHRQTPNSASNGHGKPLSISLPRSGLAAATADPFSPSSLDGVAELGLSLSREPADSVGSSAARDRLRALSPLPQRRALHHLLPRRLLKPIDLAPLPRHAVIYSTAPVLEKKSIFVGHAVRVKSVDEATLALKHVLTGKKVAKATHNILAYRIASPASTSIKAGSDCNGEPPAGKHLLALLDKLGIEDVLLVVTRWYGGVPMGGARFQVINQVGREALRLDGFIDAVKSRENGKG
ncbi:hypothetical protein JCM11641_008375 [Rhodosporidiobolus odoratus]